MEHRALEEVLLVVDKCSLFYRFFLNKKKNFMSKLDTKRFWSFEDVKFLFSSSIINKTWRIISNIALQYIQFNELLGLKLC